MTAPQSQPAAEPKRQSDEQDLQEQSSFVQYVHDYICDFIKFADQKAAFIFAGASAFLALVYNQGGRAIWHMALGAWRTREWLAGVAIVLTVASAVLAILAVAPRLKGARRGVIYWSSISGYSDAAEYRAALANLDLRGVTDEISRHCYELSRITKRKYELLKWAMWTGMAGLAVGGVYLLFF
jgi:pycsar effector protein